MTSSSSSSAVCVLEDFFFDEPPWLLLLLFAVALDVVVVEVVETVGLSCSGSGTGVVGIVVVVVACEVVCDCWVCKRLIGFVVGVVALAFDVEFELVLSVSSLLVELCWWLDVCGRS